MNKIDQLREIFDAARNLESDQRRTYLNRACAADHDLRERVDALLVADLNAGSFLNVDDQADVTVGTSVVGEQMGTIVGPYTICELLGEGGMGVVYVADQTQPVRRKVALKVIKPGMDTKQVIGRFEAERQTLAMMDHPNIAKMLDAGSTDSGRPYFVMDLVRGVPITEYCDQAKLSNRQRLELFVTVCDALQHAHQKGIIHRDIKPSNILVTKVDDDTVPKLIDFGVAKATSQSLTDLTRKTSLGQLVGTPMYMSPEQAHMDGVDTDTRTDVYSLGVVLYELLSGQTPFHKDELSKASFDEMRRMIREVDPPRPSARCSTLTAEEGSAVANHRGVELGRLSLAMQRELDWIVMKALEKDRDRRYQSASELAQDIQRYLADEPVQACPPTLGYHLQKLARRNKVALFTASIVVASVLAGTVVSIWQTREAIRARQLVERQSTQLVRQRDIALENEATAQQLVYAADIRQVDQAWKDGDVRHYANILARQTPSNARQDLREFAWRYLHQLGTADSQTLLKGDLGICSVRFSADGRFLAAGRYDGTIEIMDGHSGDHLATLGGHQDLVRGIDFSPDSTRLASVGYGGAIRIWDTESFSLIRKISDAHHHGYRICFALGGQAVIAISDDSLPTLWDVDSGELIDTFSASGNVSKGLAVSPDGKLCAICRTARTIGIWQLSPKKFAARIYGAFDDDSIWSLRFSHNGAFIAVGTDKGAVHVFEIRTRKRIASFVGHDDPVTDVAFHPNSNTLASCDGGGVIRTWHLDPGKNECE